MRIENLERVEPFVTKDGSEIRELAGVPTGNAANQSLAEASLPAGAETEEHYHRASEEIYFFTSGSGRLRLDSDESEVAPGDTVVIAPGVRHKLWNTGDEPLKLLCCCSPPYSHEDTVLVESQENVEVVKRGWEAWLRGDLDAVFEAFDPAIEWDTTNLEGWPEDEVYHGHEGVRRFFEGWLASWERYESGVEEYLDAGGDRVVVICWQRGYGPGSHVPVQMDWAQVCTLKRGLVCRLEAYSDRDEARKAAGLCENDST